MTRDGSLRRLIYTRDLLFTLVMRDISLRYRRSVLGIAWSLLNPLLQLLVFYLVFRFLLPLNIVNYTSFLFTGLIAWAWFQSSLVSATGAIVDNSPLIRQPGFPESVLPVVAVISNLVNFLFALPVLIGLLVVEGHRPGWAAMALPLVIAVQFVLTLSIAYLLASVHVPFRDTQYLVGVLLMLGFYLTPVFYDAGSIPARYRNVYDLNPLVHVIGAYRSIFLRNEFPVAGPLVLTGVISAALLALTFTLFARARYRFIEEL